MKRVIHGLLLSAAASSFGCGGEKLDTGRSGNVTTMIDGGSSIPEKARWTVVNMSEEPLTHVYLCSDVSEPLGCFDVISGPLPPDQSVYTHTPPGRRRFVVVNLYDECVASTEQDVPGGKEAIFKVVSYEGDMAWGEVPTCIND